jgi:hypothetical protein
MYEPPIGDGARTHVRTLAGSAMRGALAGAILLA